MRTSQRGEAFVYVICDDMSDMMRDGGSTEEHRVGKTTNQHAPGALTVSVQKDTSSAAGKPQHSQESQPFNGERDPTPSPRRQMPSGLSASISPETLAGSVDGVAQLQDDAGAATQTAGPGALSAGAGSALQSSPAAAAASSTAMGGGNGQKSASAAAVRSVRLEVNRSPMEAVANVRREPVAEHQAAAPGVLTTGASAPPSHESTVAGAVPGLARMAAPYQGNNGGIPTFMHGQAGPLHGMRDNPALQNPGGRVEPPRITQVPRYQLLGERLDGPPDPRALDTIMSARHGQAPASNGWGGGDFRGIVGGGVAPVSKSCRRPTCC